MTDTGLIQTGAVVFVFGLCIGSFLNVCIFRIPADRSIVFPGSMCPRCGAKIRLYDNIPLLSYVWLGAKCRQCKAPISLRYPLIELMCGLFAVGCLLRFGVSWESLVYFAFIAVLIVITFIDIDHRIIPDVISIPGIVVFFLAALLLPSIHWKDSLLGVLAGGGSLYAVAYGYYLLTRREGMGGGDIKLLAMIGALIGWKGVFFTIFVASATGTVVGLVMMVATGRNMKLAVPFGPFLALGAIAHVFFGPQLLEWYLNVL